MAGNHPFMQYGMDQRQMEWSQMAQNNQMSLNYTRPPAQPQYGQFTSQPNVQCNSQPTGQRTFSRAQLETARLFEDAICEVRNLTYNSSNMQVMDSHYEKRRNFQEFLAKQCRGSVIYNYIISSEFLINFDSSATLQAVQRVTGMDAAALKNAMKISIQSNTLRTRQVQMNQPVSQGNQFVDFQHNQSVQNAGNFTQFQVQGTNNTLHNGGARSYSAINSMSSMTIQSQRTVNTFTQESIIENMSQYLHPQTERVSASQQQPQLTHFNNQQPPQLAHFNNQQQPQLTHSNIQQPPQHIHTNTQQQPRWYSMPTERYEAGRVVQQIEKQSPQQVTVQSGGHGGPFRESAHQTVQIPMGQQINQQQSLSQARNIVKSPPYQTVPASTLSIYSGGESGTSNASSLQLLNQTVNQIQPRSNSVGCNSRKSPHEIKSTYHRTHNQNASQIQPRSNSVECKSSRGKSQPNSEWEPLSQGSVICSPNEGASQIQSRASSADSRLTNGKGEQTRNTVFSDQGERKTATPPDSKEQLRQMLKELNTTPVEQDSSQRPQEIKAQNSSVESQPRIATPNAAIAEISKPGVEQPENSDILELFSMPVIDDDVGVSKDVTDKSIPSRKDILKSFDDMNVLSPFTSDVVSDSVDSWLSGSRRSELLDQLGLKSNKEKQNKSQKKSSVESVSGESSKPNSGHVRTLESDAKETKCTKQPEGTKVPHSDNHTDNSKINEKHDSAEVTDNSKINEKHDNAEVTDNSKINEKHDGAEATETHRGLGEYDPPLPVIKLKKREGRISPLKSKTVGGISNTNIHERHESGESSTQSKGNREPLFSVLDNMLTQPSDSAETQDNSSMMQDDKSHDKEKRRHKSTEVSSSINKSGRMDSTGSKERTVEDTGGLGKKHIHCSQEQTLTVSARQKVYSNWSGKYNENEKGRHYSSKLHMRRKSCPDQHRLENRTSKGRRSLTWDGSSISTDKETKETKESSDKTNSSVHPNQFVWLHGQKLLLVTIPEGQYIVMKELIASSLSGHDSTEVYRRKTSELNINNKPLTHSCKNAVQKYLSINNINCPSQIDIVSLSDAQKLLHHLSGVTSCDENCISMDGLSDQSPVREPEVDPAKKDRSASPDSTVLGDNQSSASGASKASAVNPLDGKCKYDLQQNKVSSQSLDDMDDTTQDDENDDDASSVSDATDLYCDGKPLPLENVCENGDGVSKLRLHIEFDGGLAVFEKKDMPNRFLRFVNIRGNKCFLYQDLFRLFGQAEVVKIVINDTMRVKTCTIDEAEYLNQNQPDLIPVDPADNAFIHEKYVRKIFAYFGEPYPKARLHINVNLNDYKFPFKTDHEPPTKKLKQNEQVTNELNSFELHGDNNNKMTEIAGSSAKHRDSSSVENAGHKRKFDEVSFDEECPEILNDDDTLGESRNENSHHLLAAEIAALKAELKETKENNISLANRCKTFEDELQEAKAEWEETIQKKAELEQRYRKQEDVLSKLQVELEAKEKDKQVLQKERDHYKDFVERITDTYKVADDAGEEMEICYDEKSDTPGTNQKKLKWHHYTAN